MKVAILGAFGNRTLSDLRGFFLKLMRWRQKKFTQIAQNVVANAPSAKLF
jgi:hypothetical protein